MESLWMRAAMPTLKARSKAAPRRASTQLLAAPWRLRESSSLQILGLIPFTKLDWLVHGFSTRPGGVSILESQQPECGRPRPEKVLNLGYTDWDRPERVDENRRRFANALRHPEMPLVALRQIHSDIAHVVAQPFAQPPKGDALASSTPGLLLAIQTADCVPILLVDPRHRAVAAIHAGWRGTLGRIAAKALGRMQMEFATRSADVLVAIGPGIGQCCYEVGPDVVKEFAAQFPRAKSWFEGPFDVLASGEDPNPLPWLTMMPPGHEPPPPRCHLDLKAANAALLIDAGVPPKNIFTSDLCTSCRTDLFFSYRRERTTGRMMSVIGII
jgi:polyphenol oxidase